MCVQTCVHRPHIRQEVVWEGIVAPEVELQIDVILSKLGLFRSPNRKIFLERVLNEHFKCLLGLDLLSLSYNKKNPSMLILEQSKPLYIVLQLEIAFIAFLNSVVGVLPR